jgi:hypothetical protein
MMIIPNMESHSKFHGSKPPSSNDSILLVLINRGVATYELKGHTQNRSVPWRPWQLASSEPAENRN